MRNLPLQLNNFFLQKGPSSGYKSYHEFLEILMVLCFLTVVGVYGDFVNFEDLSAQSSKILIGIEFAYVRS